MHQRSYCYDGFGMNKRGQILLFCRFYIAITFTFYYGLQKIIKNLPNTFILTYHSPILQARNQIWKGGFPASPPSLSKKLTPPPLSFLINHCAI